MPESKNKLPSQMGFHWIWSAVSASVALTTLAFRYALPVRDGDLWWHMLYGKYFLGHKTLIADHTIYSWTPATNDTIYCTWIPDIFLYLLHKIAGLPGLFVFRYVCLFFFVLACFLFLRRLRAASNPIAWLIILIGVLMSYVAVYIKPEIVSYVLMTLLVWTWWRIRTGGENIYRRCYAIPLIMLIWVNSHGGFVFGYIFLVTVVTGETLNTWWSHGNTLPETVRKHLWIAIGISLIVPILNPYGWRYPNQLFWSLIPTEGNLAYNSKVFAYTPTFKIITPFHAFTLYANLAIVILAALYFFNLKKKNIEWSSLLSNLVFALLYTLYFRTTFFWAPVFAFSAIALLTRLKAELYCLSLKARFAIASIAVLLAAGLSADALNAGYTEPEQYVQAGRFGISFHNPVDCAEYIKQHFPSSRIGNTYINGSYLLWTLWPDAKVLIDPRHFPFKNWSDEYYAFNNGGNFSAFLNKYRADIWCIGNSNVDLYSRFLYSPDWKLAFYGRGSSVFVRDKPPLSEGKHYEVALDILDTDNSFTLMTVCLFAEKAQDWATAERILSKMEQSFNQPRNSNYLSAAKTALSGMKAFADHNYQKAIDILGPLSASFKLEISASHLRLAELLVNMNQPESARQHAYAALKADPHSLHSLFSAALIDWFLFNRLPRYHNDQVRQSYMQKLGIFNQYAQNDTHLKTYVEISQRILSEGYSSTNPLPPLPIPRFHAIN